MKACVPLSFSPRLFSERNMGIFPFDENDEVCLARAPVYVS